MLAQPPGERERTIDSGYEKMQLLHLTVSFLS